MSSETWAAELVDAVAGTRWFVARAWLDASAETQEPHFCVSLVHSSGRETTVVLPQGRFATVAQRSSELRRLIALGEPIAATSTPSRIVRTWFKEHDNSWRTIVGERQDGSFEAGAESPIVTGSMRTDLTRHPTFDAAAASGEDDLRRAGHRCSTACGDWQMVIAPP